MALITPDFSEVSERGNLKPGVYKVRITGAEVKEWAAKDDKPARPYVRWELETFGGEANGRKIWTNTDIAGKGAFRLQNLYKAALGESIGNGGFDTEMLMGKEVEVVLKDGVNYKTGQPSGYTEVDSVKAIS